VTTVQEVIKPTITTGDLVISVDQLTPIITGASSMDDMRHQARRIIVQQLMQQ
jgi:hypothetical protein